MIAYTGITRTMESSTTTTTYDCCPRTCTCDCHWCSQAATYTVMPRVEIMYYDADIKPAFDKELFDLEFIKKQKIKNAQWILGDRRPVYQTKKAPVYARPHVRKVLRCNRKGIGLRIKRI